MSRREPIQDLEPQPTTHAGLWLDRYLKDLDAQGAKQSHIEKVLEKVQVPPSYRGFFARWKNGLEALPDTVLAKATSRGRLIVGLGAESVLEAGISLHRTYGVPVLPGSGLKGLAAAAAHRHVDDPRWKRASRGTPIGAFHRVLFGDQESSGYVIFHDALWWPDNGSSLPMNLDTMTPHHTDFYLGKAVPPSDWDNPVPVPFVSARGSFLLALTGPPDWVEVAFTLLKDALDQDGAGAKTQSGYGRMDLSRLASPGSPAELGVQIGRITISNAQQEVPRLLAGLQGEARRKAAQELRKKLKQNLRGREHQAWVQELLKAAE